MGLAEKRALKAFQDEHYAKCLASVARIARKEVPIDVEPMAKVVSDDYVGRTFRIRPLSLSVRR